VKRRKERNKEIEKLDKKIKNEHKKGDK